MTYFQSLNKKILHLWHQFFFYLFLNQSSNCWCVSGLVWLLQYVYLGRSKLPMLMLCGIYSPKDVSIFCGLVFWFCYLHVCFLIKKIPQLNTQQSTGRINDSTVARYVLEMYVQAWKWTSLHLRSQVTFFLWRRLQVLFTCVPEGIIYLCVYVSCLILVFYIFLKNIVFSSLWKP